MDDIHDLTRMTHSSLNGRECPPDGYKRPKPYKEQIETRPLPFETESLKVRRPVIPKRVQSSVTKTRPNTSVRREEGDYSIRFDDYTWANTQPQHDHYANRGEIIDMIYKYNDLLKNVSGNDLELAAGYQEATDLLLDALSMQLRAESREQCEVVENARRTYAHVFALMQNDAKKCREEINRLNKVNASLDENLTKVIDDATERVNEAREDCARQINDVKRQMEDKKDEYDTSMKRFLEQKQQLEEHVKALHRVFIDFQSDSVYITLEDLKQKQQSVEKKLRSKENEIQKLNAQLSKMQKQIKETEDSKGVVEQANDELRRKLQASMALANRLQRHLDMQNIQDETYQDDFDDDEGNIKLNPKDLPIKPLIASDTVLDSVQNATFGGRSRRRGPQVDPGPFMRVTQKLGKIQDRISDVLQRFNTTTAIMPEITNDDTEKLLLSCDANLMMRLVEQKTDDVSRLAEALDVLDMSAGPGGGGQLAVLQPRFLQYICQHKDTADSSREKKKAINIHMIIRQIFQSKYISDSWNKRMNKPPMRFPEFIIAYHCKDGENMFTALQRCTRLYRYIEGNKLPEIKVFRKFLLEKFTVDELSFFLEMRTALLGTPSIKSDEPTFINVTFDVCKDLMTRVLGVFSPVVATATAEAEQYVKDGLIDYAQFILVLLKFYKNERTKRRNALNLLYQSRRYTNTNGTIQFESFVSMLQTLGFQGSIDDLFDLYHEAVILGGGDACLKSIHMAMDNLSFHFYSIELPVKLNKASDITSLNRSQLNQHWLKFNGWFEAFQQPRDNFDTWLRSKLIRQVKDLNEYFKTNAPIPVLFTGYRQLLDFFQFTLDVLARGQSRAMPATKTERELLILENLIDLLITFIVSSNDGDFVFCEFE